MHLVLIEDQPVIRALVAEILRAEGHQVAEFPAAAEGLAYFSSSVAEGSPPDAVLLDWLLPDLSGEQALRALMIHPRCHCLVISGYALEIQQLPPEWSARVRFLPKPFTPRMLGEALAALTSGPSGTAVESAAG